MRYLKIHRNLQTQSKHIYTHTIHILCTLSISSSDDGCHVYSVMVREDLPSSQTMGLWKISQ